MTNKKFRDDLAKEMRDKYNERNEKLEQAEKSSFSSGLKEQMKKEIMDNFTKEMDEMKSRPGYEEAKKTHLEEIKAKIGVNAAKKEKERLQKEYEEKLAKADEDIADKNKAYEDAQIAHRGEVEQKITENSDNKEKSEIPQDLKDFREAWKEKIRYIDNEIKEKIIKAAETIPVKVEIDNDGSRLIEFELGGKTWKILDPKLEKYSEGFRPDWEDGYIDSINRIYDYNHVKLAGMRGDDVENWENKKLKDYVKEKKNEGLDIASKKQIGEILSSLGEKVEFDSEEYQISMLMYLTGMDGWYWLRTTSGNSRFSLECFDRSRNFGFYSNDLNSASLCMIACQ